MNFKFWDTCTCLENIKTIGHKLSKPVGIIQKMVEIMWEWHVKNERFERFSYLQFDTLLLFTSFSSRTSAPFLFFFSHCRHVFGIKHSKRERETCFSRQVVLKELLRSGLPSKVSVQVCLPSRHVGFVYLFPELLRRAGLSGYFFKEVWGKCAWFLDLSNIVQILGAPGASLLNLSF